VEKRVVARQTGPRTRQKMTGWIEIFYPPTCSALSPPKKGAGWSPARQPSYQTLKIFILVG
jgi:hypothetical protein